MCRSVSEAEGIDWFGVAITEEGIELREAGITRPILCLGSFWPGQEEAIMTYQLTPVVFELEIAKVLSAAVGGGSYDIHVQDRHRHGPCRGSLDGCGGICPWAKGTIRTSTWPDDAFGVRRRSGAG